MFKNILIIILLFSISLTPCLQADEGVKRIKVKKKNFKKGKSKNKKYDWFHKQLDKQRDKTLESKPVTKGPKYHWFAYYDKFQFNETGRYILGMEVDFEGFHPAGNDKIDVGIIDLKNGNRWTKIGESKAWGWQQGCMLQWRPAHKKEILWNDQMGDHYVCHIYNMETKQKRTLPRAVYTVSPDGKLGISIDWRRLNDMRPGYGYAGIDDPNKKNPAPKNSGIWLVNLDTGENRLLFSLEEIAELPGLDGKNLKKNVKNYVNCALWNTDGSRFIFLHRYRKVDKSFKTTGGFTTRMLSASKDGKDLRIVSEKRGVSHFIWRDPKHISIWHNNNYYLYKDNGSGKSTVQWPAPNGHQTYVPGTDNQWMLTDTYACNEKNEQVVYLMHLPTQTMHVLGYFPRLKKYKIDAHPRTSRDGKFVVIDSTYGGQGRQMYIMDISEILKKH